MQTFLCLPWHGTCIQSSKEVNVDISNTTGPIHRGFVASERKSSWPHFSITILGAGKYNQSFKKTIKVKIFIFGFYCNFSRMIE
jgi:hypothetical protein